MTGDVVFPIGAWPSGGRPLRGVETSLGQAGFCSHCGGVMPDGPDACLGWIDGVAAACCGHGEAGKAYVVTGAEPDADLSLLRQGVDFEVLCGVDALAFFAERGVGPSP